MDIRGITFSIEALPIRKGLPLFLFSTIFLSVCYINGKHPIIKLMIHYSFTVNPQPQVTYHHSTFLRQYLLKLSLWWFKISFQYIFYHYFYNVIIFKLFYQEIYNSHKRIICRIKKYMLQPIFYPHPLQTFIFNIVTQLLITRLQCFSVFVICYSDCMFIYLLPFLLKWIDSI